MCISLSLYIYIYIYRYTLQTARARAVSERLTASRQGRDRPIGTIGSIG